MGRNIIAIVCGLLSAAVLECRSLPTKLGRGAEQAYKTHAKVHFIYNLGRPIRHTANANNYALAVVPGCCLVVQHNVDQ